MSIPNLIIFIVIVLIVLVIAYVVYSILIWHHTTKDPHYLDDPGSKFHVIDMHTAYFTDEECKESGICFSTTPIISTARPLFTKKNKSSQYEFAANIAGAMELSNNEAIVMDVKIPSKPIVYCGITGYIYDIPSSRRRKVIYFPLGNISSLGHEKQCGKRMYAILTSNPLIAAKVAKKYESTGIVRVININENYCNPDFRFSLLGRVAHSKTYRKKDIDSASSADREITVKNPTFRTRKIVFPGIKEHYFPAMYTPQRDPESTTELNIDENQWQNAASEIVSRLRGVQSRACIPVNISGTRDFDSLPGNLDLPEADNHDMTIFRSDEIKVNPDEFILVVYVDHNKSGESQFSTISFFDSDREFAYKSIPPESLAQPETRSAIRSYIHIPSAEMDTIVIKEMIFSNPRCHPDSVHHMQVFVLKRT